MSALAVGILSAFLFVFEAPSEAFLLSLHTLNITHWLLPFRGSTQSQHLFRFLLTHTIHK